MRVDALDITKEFFKISAFFVKRRREGKKKENHAVRNT
jgi:hypothetical protein